MNNAEIDWNHKMIDKYRKSLRRDNQGSSSKISGKSFVGIFLVQLLV